MSRCGRLPTLKGVARFTVAGYLAYVSRRGRVAAIAARRRRLVVDSSVVARRTGEARVLSGQGKGLVLVVATLTLALGHHSGHTRAAVDNVGVAVGALNPFSLVDIVAYLVHTVLVEGWVAANTCGVLDAAPSVDRRVVPTSEVHDQFPQPPDLLVDEACDPRRGVAIKAVGEVCVRGVLPRRVVEAHLVADIAEGWLPLGPLESPRRCKKDRYGHKEVDPVDVLQRAEQFHSPVGASILRPNHLGASAFSLAKSNSTP